jgi:hypothetical protein
VLALVEPIAVVVAREAAQELEGFGGEVSGHIKAKSRPRLQSVV